MSIDGRRPLVMHVVYRFATGGLENGVANLINRMPAGAYRHAIVALTEVTDFKERIRRDDVEFFALDKPPGHALRLYPQLYRLFREQKPQIVHTRNLGALEVTVPAWAAGVPVRIHGEHGRDIGDYDGSSRKHQWIRRIYRPFVTKYLALSRDLADYLMQKVGIPESRVSQIYNGVDAQRFSPAASRMPIDGCPFSDDGSWLVGTVGRMQTVKDQNNLVRAFIAALKSAPELRSRLRLILVGEGPLRAQAQSMLDEAGIADIAWLPGERVDIPAILQGLDCFVLPSLAEGISNTILEAMASGLPVIATAVGGNGELVDAGQTGILVPPADPDALAQAILKLACNPAEASKMGNAGRAAVESRFSLDAMVEAYRQLYDELLFSTRKLAPQA